VSECAALWLDRHSVTVALHALDVSRLSHDYDYAAFDHDASHRRHGTIDSGSIL